MVAMLSPMEAQFHKVGAFASGRGWAVQGEEVSKTVPIVDLDTRRPYPYTTRNEHLALYGSGLWAWGPRDNWTARMETFEGGLPCPYDKRNVVVLFDNVPDSNAFRELFRGATRDYLPVCDDNVRDMMAGTQRRGFCGTWR
jgi:hypothetical protein